MTDDLPISSITIRDRSRRELRNIDALAASIHEVGLLNPSTVRCVDDTWVLAAGQRRLAAMGKLGWVTTPVTIAASIEDETGTRHQIWTRAVLCRFCTVQALSPSTTRKTRHKVAKAAGTSHDTLFKARHVIDTAEDPDTPPEVAEVAKRAAANLAARPARAHSHRLPLRCRCPDRSDTR